MPSTMVAVLGATGVYGRHLVPRLVEAGYGVRALVREPAAATLSAACGAEIHAADIFDGASLRAALAGCDVAINLATSLPSPAKAGGDFDLNDRLRREGVPIFLEACASAGAARVIQQSIAMVHGGGGDAWADEDTRHPVPQEATAGRAIMAARDMEATVAATRLDWLILRGALFYGPGTGFDDDWLARARAGKLRLPGAGEDYVTLVHIADMADATIAALSRWPSRQSLIVADDSPARWRELFAFAAAAAGGPPPTPGGPPRFPSFRLSNRRAREALAWSPRYPSYRVGLAR
ncbi:MAG: NAD(P)-dependent oxidoreductase [Hyphomicrobiaceae bacterium]